MKPGSVDYIQATHLIKEAIIVLRKRSAQVGLSEEETVLGTMGVYLGWYAITGSSRNEDDNKNMMAFARGTGDGSDLPGLEQLKDALLAEKLVAVGETIDSVTENINNVTKKLQSLTALIGGE
jgi:hypothetical protein